MRIRLERRHPILRIPEQHPGDEPANPDLSIVTLAGPDVEVLDSWTIAVEVEHDCMKPGDLRDMALDAMDRMIDIAGGRSS